MEFRVSDILCKSNMPTSVFGSFFDFENQKKEAGDRCPANTDKSC
jgi:hypothetical protein